MAPYVSVYAGQVKDPTHGVNILHVVNSSLSIVSSINPHDWEELDLEVCTFHNYLPALRLIKKLEFYINCLNIIVLLTDVQDEIKICGPFEHRYRLVI